MEPRLQQPRVFFVGAWYFTVFETEGREQEILKPVEPVYKLLGCD
jgi:hypothetical protein